MIKITKEEFVKLGDKISKTTDCQADIVEPMIDEPDTIRNELMDSGLLGGDAE